MKWKELSAKGGGGTPSGRGGHDGVAQVGGSCYFFGGADRTAKVYDEVVKCTVSSGTTSWEKVSLSMESGEGCLSRTGCSCTLIGNEMYIFAGQEPSSGTLFNDIFKVDLETKTLKRVSVNGGSPPPRHSHGCILLNDKCMFVFGGAGRDAPLNDSWIFDSETCCWTYPAVTGAIPRPREMHTAAKVGGKVVVLGGRDAGGRVLQEMNVLDIEKLEWEKPRNTGHPRCAHSCVPVKLAESLVAGTVEEGSEEGQRGLIILGGFSGAQVENSVLFVTQDLSSVLDVTDQVSGSPPAASFAHASVPVSNEATGCTEAILSFGGINLSEDCGETLLSFV